MTPVPAGWSAVFPAAPGKASFASGGVHSEKPQQVYEIIERMYPALPKAVRPWGDVKAGVLGAIRPPRSRLTDLAGSYTIAEKGGWHGGIQEAYSHAKKLRTL